MKTYRKKPSKSKMRKLNNSYYPAIKNGILISDEDFRKEMATAYGIDSSLIVHIRVYDKDTNELKRDIQFKDQTDA